MSRRPILLSFIIVFAIVVLMGTFFLVIGLASKGSWPMAFGDIAIIEIEGPIFESKTTLKEIERIKEIDSIKAVVVRVDTPGGAVVPAQEIYEELHKLKEKKKIIISMGTVAASGGYYIACAGDLIVANPGTITGSIGVIMEDFGLQELMKDLKIENRVLKTGEFKDVGNPFREMSASEKAYLRQILNNMYDQFKAVVAKSRKLSSEKVESLAQGRIYTGEQALENGLIDRIGTLYGAIEEAKNIAGLPKDARVIWPKDKESAFDALFGSMIRVFLKNINAGLVSRSGIQSTKPLYMWH